MSDYTLQVVLAIEEFPWGVYDHLPNFVILGEKKYVAWPGHHFTTNQSHPVFSPPRVTISHQKSKWMEDSEFKVKYGENKVK